MTAPEGPPPSPQERIRMPMRIAAVFVGWVLYLVVPGPLIGRVLLWAGFIAVDWAVVDKVTTRREEPIVPRLVGQVLLGAALIAVGIVLVLR